MKMRESNIQNHVNWIDIMISYWALHFPLCVCNTCCDLRILISKEQMTYPIIQNSKDIFEKCISQDKAKKYAQHLIKYTAYLKPKII